MQIIKFLETIPNETVTLKKGDDILYVGLVTVGWGGINNFTIEAKDEGVRCHCIFFILGQKEESFLAKIESAHISKNSEIKIYIRSALTDDSICNIEGVARVAQEASGSETYFSNHTLLLSSNSSAKTAPNLEINTDDVRAGHAASVGKVDEDSLFYLMSRGLSEKQAKTMLVEGFFETELGKIDDDQIRDQIRSNIYSFLHH